MCAPLHSMTNSAAFTFEDSRSDGYFKREPKTNRNILLVTGRHRIYICGQW